MEIVNSPKASTRTRNDKTHENGVCDESKKRYSRAKDDLAARRNNEDAPPDKAERRGETVPYSLPLRFERNKGLDASKHGEQVAPLKEFFENLRPGIIFFERSPRLDSYAVRAGVMWNRSAMGNLAISIGGHHEKVRNNYGRNTHGRFAAGFKRVRMELSRRRRAAWRLLSRILQLRQPV